MPVWHSIYEELKDQNFEIISVAEDTGGEAAAGPVFDAAKVTYTAIIDTDHKISSLYNFVNVPSAAWIDEEGKIVRINEGTYAAQHKLGTYEFGSDEYVPALRDWVAKGAESEYVWSPEEVAEKIRPRTSDEEQAEALFKLGVHFYKQENLEKANHYWDQAQALFPDSWNMHRQDWAFIDPATRNRNFIQKNTALTKPYYAPLELDTQQ